MPFGIGIWELLILLLVLLLVFGPKRLPEMGRQLGKGMREFKDSVTGDSKRRRGCRRCRPPSPPSPPHPPRPSRASGTPSPSSPRRMIRRLAPRRLGTDEEATVVEHLTELRHRLLIVVAAIVPAFLLAFAFHAQLIEWLKRPLPAGQDARHARRRRAVHDRGQGERPRRDRDRPADPRLAGLGVPRARRRPGDPARPAVFIVVATGLFVDRRRVRLLHRPARGDHVPDELRRHALQRPDPRQLLPLVHLARARSRAGSRSRCRSSSSPSSASAFSATTSCGTTGGSATR